MPNVTADVAELAPVLVSGSISLVVKKKPLWYMSLLLAGLAAAEMARVWMS